LFGKNEIVGQKYFKDAKSNELFVTSMFGPTIQGEGPYRGEPAFFIRLAKCQLACSFCDTFFDDGDWLSFDDIESRIETTIDDFYNEKNMDRPDWTKHGEGKKKRMVLVMTGGEPLLQQNIGAFLEKMNGIFCKTQIESNGIVHQPSVPDDTTLVISPKCVEKNGVVGKYIKPNPKNLDSASCLKFVMEATEGSPYSDIPDWAHEWALTTGRDIFISPMNVYNSEPAKSKEMRNSGANRIEIEDRSTTDEVISFWEPGLLNMQENQKNHEYTAQYCVTHGFIMNLQIHLYASMA